MRRHKHRKSPQASSIAARVPPEILLGIFAYLQPAAPAISHDLLAARQFVASVAALPLVCTTWREAGTEALYRFIDATFLTPRACARVIKTLEKNRNLSRLVHGVALPRYDNFPPVRSSTGTLGLKSNFFSGRNAPIDADRVHSDIVTLCSPLDELHFPSEHTSQTIVSSGSLTFVHRARIAFSLLGRVGVPIVPHLSHVASLEIAHTDGTSNAVTQPFYLTGMEKLVPPRSVSLSTLHLANMVMPVAQWNALLSAVRKSLKQLVVHLFMLALQQGDGRDLLLPDDLLPVAGTLEELEVGTVLRPPGALHILPHLRSLSAHVAFPTVLPPPRSLPRALQCFRIVDERRIPSDTWVWALSRFVLALLRERPPTLQRVEIVTWLNGWRQLRDWGILAFLLHRLATVAGVTLQIDLRVSQSMTDTARARWAASPAAA